MPGRPRPKLAPIDPDLTTLTADQLVAEGVKKKADAARFLGMSARELDRRRKAHEIPSWKAGKGRVFPVVGLKAYLAKQAREQGVGSDAVPTPAASRRRMT